MSLKMQFPINEFAAHVVSVPHFNNKRIKMLLTITCYACSLHLAGPLSLAW